MNSDRKSWTWVWAKMALTMAARSRCVRSQIGAIIVSADNRVVATGYNGPPARWNPGDSPCVQWCDRGRGIDALSPDYSDCPSNHAEINALMHSSRADRENGMIFVTGSVCMACAKAIANSGLAFVHLVNVDPEEEQHRNPEKVNQFIRECGVQVFYVDVRTD